MLTKLQSTLSLIRETKPLVLCLTNYVTMDLMANSLLALGASPLMSHDNQEINELLMLAHAVNLNIGTLDAAFMARAKMVCEIAARHDKPIILDPVGCGASQIRTQAAQSLLPFSSIVRGNASEIMALFNSSTKTHGVDALHRTHDAQEAALQISLANHNVVVVSGENDLVTDGNNLRLLPFGAPIMPMVVGMGCTLTAVIAAFHAVVPNALEAAQLATAYFGLCGQMAYQQSSLPSSFRTAFIDTLYNPDWETIAVLLSAEEEKDQ